MGRRPALLALLALALAQAVQLAAGVAPSPGPPKEAECADGDGSHEDSECRAACHDSCGTCFPEGPRVAELADKPVEGEYKECFERCGVANECGFASELAGGAQRRAELDAALDAIGEEDAMGLGEGCYGVVAGDELAKERDGFDIVSGTLDKIDDAERGDDLGDRDGDAPNFMREL